MLGMLQIMTYLLCVYLIFKGVEIFQIAFMSHREGRRTGLVIGVLAIAVSIVASVTFVIWIDFQAKAVAGRPNSSFSYPFAGSSSEPPPEQPAPPGVNCPGGTYWTGSGCTSRP